MLRTSLVAFVASFIFFFAGLSGMFSALSWMPDAAAFLVAQTFTMEFARSNVPMLLLVSAAAAARLAWIGYEDWSRCRIRRQKIIQGSWGGQSPKKKTPPGMACQAGRVGD